MVRVKSCVLNGRFDAIQHCGMFEFVRWVCSRKQLKRPQPARLPPRLQVTSRIEILGLLPWDHSHLRSRRGASVKLWALACTQNPILIEMMQHSTHRS